MNTSAPPHKDQLNMKALVARVIVSVVLFGLLMFGSANRLDWPMAWVFMVIFGVGIFVMALVLRERNPELLKERAEFKPREGVQTWDTILSAVARLSIFGILVVSGLDIRNGWTNSVAIVAQLIALVVGLLGYGVIGWAMLSNANAAVYARIQKDRGHTVATTGPYRLVRHPFYVGVITLVLAMPVMLGSLAALIPAAIVVVLFLIKTALEDRILQAELDGYKDYARQVRYRLIPRVW